MKFKHTAILLGLVLAIIVGLIVYAMNQPEEATVGDVVFPGLAGLKVTDIVNGRFVGLVHRIND